MTIDDILVGESFIKMHRKLFDDLEHNVNY